MYNPERFIGWSETGQITWTRWRAVYYQGSRDYGQWAERIARRGYLTHSHLY